MDHYFRVTYHHAKASCTFLKWCYNAHLKLLLCFWIFWRLLQTTSCITFQKGFKNLDLYMGLGCLLMNALIHGFAGGQWTENIQRQQFCEHTRCVQKYLPRHVKLIIMTFVLLAHFNLQTTDYKSYHFKLLTYSRKVQQGCALAEPGGPWRLTFALGRLENLRFFIQIICWAPWILQFQSTGLPSIFLREQPCTVIKLDQ